MKTIVVTTICIGCIFLAYAQPVWLSVNKQPTAGTYSKHHQRLFTALQNQAGLSWLKSTCFGVYTERRFLLAALSAHTAAIAFPTGLGAFACMVQQAGFREYHEQLLGGAYSHQLGQKASAGIQFNYQQMMIAGYGSSHTMTTEIGGLLQVTPQLIAGIHAYNSINNKLLPVVYSAGLGYEATDNFVLSTALVQQEGIPPAIKVMCEYALIPQCLMEFSWGTDSMQRSLSIAFELRKFHVKVFAAHHPQLGFSPGTMIIWQV